MDILDTTSFSAAMRNDPAVVDFLKARKPGDVAVVPPVVAEIEYGIRRLPPGTQERALLESRQGQLLAAVRLLDWIPQASVEFGSIKAALERSGQLIDDFDIAVAAIALAHHARVITANLAHFNRIEGLRCSNWSGESASPMHP